MTSPRRGLPRQALLTHGFASSWEHNWVRHGWPDLLADADIEARSFALPGHLNSGLPPHATIDEITAAALAGAGEAEIAIGFSLGSAVTLHAAVAEPRRFAQIVLLGFGDGAWPNPGAFNALADRLVDSSNDDPDVILLRGSAYHAGADVESMASFVRVFPGPPHPDELLEISAEVLLVLGEFDPIGPATIVASALSHARIVVLPAVDHWRTPGSPAAMSAVLDFLG